MQSGAYSAFAAAASFGAFLSVSLKGTQPV